MNFCPNCGENLKDHAPKRVEVAANLIDPPQSDTRNTSPELLSRLRPKLVDLAVRIDSMTEDEYGEWINELPPDEFLVFIGLNKNEFRAIALNEQATES